MNASHGIADGMNAIADNARELIEAAAESCVARVSDAHDKGQATLAIVQAKVGAAGETAVQSTRAAARATNQYVHDAPWISMGAAALAGLLVGILLGRR